MRYRARAEIALMIAPLVIGGCRDATGPRDSLAGTYVLRSRDSQPVPILQRNDTNTREYLVADTLTFDGRGRSTAKVVTRIDSVGKSYSAYRTSHFRGRYTIRGDTIIFPNACPPLAMCVQPVGWRATDGSISIGIPTTPRPMFVMRYERIR